MRLPSEIWRNEISKYISDAKTFFNYSLVIKHIPKEIIEAKKIEFSILHREETTIGDMKVYYTLPNRILHGSYKRRYKTGEIIENFIYFNGMLHGRQEEYFSSGHLSYLRHYVNGKKHGLFQDFDISYDEESNYVLYHTATFENDKLISDKYMYRDSRIPYYMRNILIE